MIGTQYWAWFGTISLIILCFRDFKNNRMVDDRQNWLMFGITLSLYSHFNYRTRWILAIVVMSLILRYFMAKIKVLGEADHNTITWMFMGYAILSIYITLWWAVIFSIITVIYCILKEYVFKIKSPTPFYLALLIIFILNSLLWGLYI